MTLSTPTFHQEVISENQKIFEKIQHHLRNATREILVATSWFTDEILFELVLEKAKAGIVVDLIIAENTDNQKLNFDTLIAAGAGVIKIKSVGYGIMHQKFCVIDRQMAIHGSYNWSNNAKANNHESVIVTSHKDTVDSLVTTFFDIKQRAVAIINGSNPDSIKVDEPQQSSGTNSFPGINSTHHTSPLEFTNVLRALIAAETSEFDRNELRLSGYERAKATNGDAQILSTALDSLYSTFVNDINIEEEKKETLITKIVDLKLTAEKSLEDGNRLQLNSLDHDLESQANSLKLKIKNCEFAVSLSEKEIEGVKNVTVRQIQNRTRDILNELDSNARQFAPRKIKYFELVPVLFLLILVFSYLFLFYSSAAYILIFSETDTKEQVTRGVTPNPPQIFEPRALALVSEKGGTALPYVLLFVIIPIALASVDRLIDGRLWKIIFGVLLWIVDILVAIKISRAINEINYLIGDADQHFQYLDVFSDLNFYLVFAFGILGLLLYKVLFSKMMTILQENHPETAAQKNKIHGAQLRDEKSKLEMQEGNQFKIIQDFEKSIAEQKQQIETNNLSLLVIPSFRAREIEKIEAEQKSVKEAIHGIAQIYTSYITRNRVPVHVDSIKDRINVFLEGWNKFLHDEYAVDRAKEKSRQAIEVVNMWQNNKLVLTKVDNRISLN